MPVRTAVIEDDARYRDGLVQLLRGAEGFELKGSFASPLPAVREAEESVRSGTSPPWDLVVMDLEMPGMNGIEATRRLKGIAHDLKIVVLTVFEQPETILEAICAGADGYMLKKSRASELLEAFRSVADGGSPLTPNVARRVLDLMRRLGGPSGRVSGASSAPSVREDRGPTHAPSRLDLTEREQDVLRALVEGLSYKQIADQLGLGLGTVRTHITSIYRKLQVHSVAEAVGRALRDRIV